MSKQSEAKNHQGYEEKAPTCTSCKYFSCEKSLSKWQIESNAKGTSSWDAEKNGIERNIRCGKGGFAVKKQAICNCYEGK